MFILGDLIRLPVDEDKGLPLPWWYRAPLAFESGTDVFVALTDSLEDRPGEIFVSVLNPNHWDEMFRLRCRYAEEPGVISRVFGATSAWNIALAETVTIEGSRTHQLDLICEPFGQETADTDLEHLRSRLDADGFEDVVIQRLRLPEPKIDWHRKGFVRSGWVRSRRVLRWKAAVKKQLDEIAEPGDFDLSRLVVSADTENRVLRYVIPRHGARTIKIEHADEPGSLNKLTVALNECDLNILSSLLKRGGVQPDNAELVAVCEPTREAPKSGKALGDRIKERLNELPQELRADVRINRGRAADQALYVRKPGDISIRVPVELGPRVVTIKKKNQPRLFTVFLSQRFVGGRVRRYADEVKEVLAGFGCRVLQAPPKPGAFATSFDEVSAIMWAASAGLVLVAEPEDENELSFSLNLAHEFGFLQGQGKPVLVLVEDKVKSLNDLDSWSNAKGLIAPRFSSVAALDRKNNKSIEARIKVWISELFDAGYRPLAKPETE